MAGFFKLAHNQILKLSFIIISLVMLAGCMNSANVREEPRGGPIEDLRTESTKISPETQRRVSQGQLSAVRMLMRHSRRYVSEGDLSKGAVFLERALKIDPENAVLWSNLADIRFKQKELSLAESLALKSNSYARDDRDLLLRNWRIIAESRSLSGDKSGARQAAEKVDHFQGR